MGHWNYHDHPHFDKPKTTDDYLERMSKIVFSTGLNWNVVEKKWPNIRKAFRDFSTDKVAKFSDDDVERLLGDQGVIRSGSKINAIIKNARASQELEREFGSFGKYFAAMKKEGIEPLLKDLKKRFSYMGESTAVMFIFGCGEETPEIDKFVEKSHKK